jgi:hypothetical protein
MTPEPAITERQLADYEPQTTSGAALKERLEGAAANGEDAAGERRVLR